ncbi:MAG TPA: hypothetical protein DHU96_03390 [Actinobacteria bacterium]|nr:hypothetical protein [Actinomycetota bacterium]
MTKKQTVTVAGVPVTVQAADGVLTVTIGGFDPAAADGLLRVHPRFGTAAAGVYIAGAAGDTAHRPDQRWFFDLYPGPPGATESIRLCDGCFQAATGLLADAKTAARKTWTTPACACALVPMNASGAAPPAGSTISAAPTSGTCFRRSARNTRACGSCTGPTVGAARTPRRRRPGTTGTPGPRPCRTAPTPCPRRRPGTDQAR